MGRAAARAAGLVEHARAGCRMGMTGLPKDGAAGLAGWARACAVDLDDVAADAADEAGVGRLPAPRFSAITRTLPSVAMRGGGYGLGR